MFSSQKLLAAGDDAGDEASTAVTEYEPKSISSAKRRKSSDYQRSREYRGSNLSSRSRKLVSESQRKSADNVTDAKYEEISDAEYAKSVKKSMKSVYGDIPSARPSDKRPSTKSFTKSSSKRPSETSTQKSSKQRVVDTKDLESDFSLDEQRRIWSRYGKTEDETYKKVTAAREDAEYSIGMKKAKLRGQQQGIDLDDVEELAYQAEANRRETEQLKKDVRKAQERGINRTTPFPEKIAKQGKVVGKAIGEGFKEIDKETAVFAQSHMGKNIARTNEETLKGMQVAGERARKSIAGNKVNITRSALNKPRAFGSSTTNPVPKITTRILRHGKNDVVCYFDQYGRQVSAAAARAHWAGKNPAQNINQTNQFPLTQHNTAPFALGRSGNPLGDLRNHGIPFAVGGTYEAPFAPRHYQSPFAVGSKPTFVISYNGNPIGNVRREGNPLGDIRWVSGNPLGAVRREGNPLGNMVRVSDPLGVILREGNPLGDDERRGHTSCILRGQIKKDGNPAAGDEKAGHTSRMLRGQTKKSGNPVAEKEPTKRISNALTKKPSKKPVSSK